MPLTYYLPDHHAINTLLCRTNVMPYFFNAMIQNPISFHVQCSLYCLVVGFFSERFSDLMSTRILESSQLFYVLWYDVILYTLRYAIASLSCQNHSWKNIMHTSWDTCIRYSTWSLDYTKSLYDAYAWEEKATFAAIAFDTHTQINTK